MIELQKLLASCLTELKHITKADFCLLDHNGAELVSTYETFRLPKKEVEAFQNSAADSQNLQGYLFMKIREGKEYVLITSGRDGAGYALAQIACSEIVHIIRASSEELDEHHFYLDLLENRLTEKEAKEKAGVLQIPENLLRVVFLVEIEKDQRESGRELLANLFDDQGGDYVDSFDQEHLLLIKALKNKKEAGRLMDYAQQIVSMCNTELLTSVRVAFGNQALDILEIAKSYHEAKIALDVAQIFYDGRMVASYASLGIGRLIHELPIPLCETFLDEVFGGRKLSLTEEEMATIDKFFDNNLNISETARELFMHRNTLVYHLEKLQKSTGLDIRKFDDALTFKIAVMVAKYLKRRPTKEK